MEIPIRKQPSSLSPSGRLSKTRCAVSDDIHAIARTFKARMANAVSKVTGATATTTCNNEQPKEMAPSSGVVSYQLKNMELLKQYLIFLSLETTVRLEKQDNGNHAILIDPPNERLPHPGARLIESLVHNTPCKMSNTLEGTVTAVIDPTQYSETFIYIQIMQVDDVSTVFVIILPKTTAT